MRIGILITSVSNFGEKGFYNIQEVGLAKAFASLSCEVLIYKAVPFENVGSIEQVKGFNNVWLHSIPTKQYGINGLFDVAKLDTALDVLVYFSDTQLSVPKVYRWAQKNNVLFFPYIGVMESHSTNKLKKVLMNALFVRNLGVYKKCACFVKTPGIAQKLQRLGVKKATVAPVGLDFSLLNQDYAATDATALKATYGYQPEDKVILFIGRLTEEKQPLRMLQLFKMLYQKDASYRLLVVGKGELQQQLTQAIKEEQMDRVVTHLVQLPNADIWQLYRMADCFVNLNEQEIFGMAILEAMYYECKVVALHAPGPDFIIEDGVSGCLAQNDAQLIEAVRSAQLQPQVMHDRIVQHFTWQVTAKVMEDLIKQRG